MTKITSCFSGYYWSLELTSSLTVFVTQLSRPVASNWISVHAGQCENGRDCPSTEHPFTAAGLVKDSWAISDLPTNYSTFVNHSFTIISHRITTDVDWNHTLHSTYIVYCSNIGMPGWILHVVTHYVIEKSDFVANCTVTDRHLQLFAFHKQIRHK